VTDDIVTRLREQACPECGLPSTHNQYDEAASEIERLRTELSETQTKLAYWREIALENQTNA
jgi:hypothetical protein